MIAVIAAVVKSLATAAVAGERINVIIRTTAFF